MDKNVSKYVSMSLYDLQDAIKNNNNVFVIWSGGYDSTMIILKALEFKKQYNSESKIIAIGVISPLVSRFKNEREINARKEIHKELKDAFDYYELDMFVYKNGNQSSDREETTNNIQSLPLTTFPDKLPQSVLWVSAFSQIMMLVSKGSIICLGYLSEITDDLPKYFKDYESFLEGYFKINFINYEDLNLKIVFPFAEIYTKEKLLKEFINKDKPEYMKIYSLCTCCEANYELEEDEHHYFCNCHACRTHKHALVDIIDGYGRQYVHDSSNKTPMEIAEMNYYQSVKDENDKIDNNTNQHDE